MLFSLIFGGVGVVMLIVVISLASSWNSFKDTACEASAVISDINVHKGTYKKHGKTRHRTDYTVYIDYTVDGQEYHDTLGYYVSGMAVGDEVTVLYDPEDPSRLMSDPTPSCVISGIFALIFGGIGAALLLHELNKSKFVNRLIEKDAYVVCYDWEEVNSGTRVNNVRYKQIVCHYEDLGRTFQFHSAPYHPNKCPVYPGQPITVYVDLDEPKKYYVYMG